MDTIRTAFTERFGEDQAAAIESAAEGHGNGINDGNRGTDPFKWALLVAIGYQCMEIKNYRAYHGITAPWPDLKEWIIAQGKLAEHDGDCDYLAALAGTYNEFVGMPPVGEAVQ
jgi:hypothetical protein